ncbi:MAG: MATE family efflux transporter [Lachnospiraceae bacterium]|nr:MATE family efflux transporter [Lachnospiraceae bacterium]
MEEMNQNPLGTAPVAGLLRKFAVPSIIAMLVSSLYNIVDQFFIGRSVGELGNAATNVAFPLTTSCTAIALLFGIGGAAAFNLTMGRGEREKAIYYIGNALVCLFGLGLILCVITQLFLTPMLRFFGSPDNVLDYARAYTGITSFGFPFLILANGGGHLIRADGSPGFTMISNVSGAVINTILDPVFIFRLHMGMQGAALATIIGQIFSGCLVIWYMKFRFKTGKLRICHLIPRWEYSGKTVSLGMTPCFNQLAMTVVQIVMNQSLTYYGRMSVYGESVPLACVGIISKVNMVFFSFIIGLSQGMQPIASFNYGARKYSRVRKVYRMSIISGLVISTFSFLLFQIWPREIINLFGSGSEEYVHFAVSYFRIFLFFTFLNGIQPISSNFFTSIGKPKKGIFLSLTRQILFLLPLIILLPLFMGIDGIMYAGPVADLIAAAVSMVLVIKEFRSFPVSDDFSVDFRK